MSVLTGHGSSVSQLKNYNSIATSRDISIAEYYKESGRPPIDVFTHDHEEYEFILPVRTIPLLTYEKANYIGEVGYIYPVNPNVPHGVALPVEDSHFFDIVISDSLVEKYKDALGYSDKMFYSRFEVPFGLLETIREFQHECGRTELNYYKIDSLTKLIVSTLVEEGLSKNEDNRRPEKTYHKNIKSVIVYMTNNSRDKKMNMVSLANMSGYSSTYFTKAFKGYMNDSPIVHLNKLRISDAKSLMLAGERSLTKIADTVGYRNLSSFTEAFKRVVGKTPSEYQNKYFKKK